MRFPMRAVGPQLGILLPHLLVALLLAAPLAGQEPAVPTPGQLSGVVVDEHSGEPVPGAMVALPGLRRTAVTNARGGFALPDVAPGEHPLVVVQLGYDTLRSTVAIAPDDAVVLELQLLPDPVVLPGVRVVADRLRSRRNAVATSVRAFDRSQLLLSAAPDALDFVSRRAGVRLTGCVTEVVGPCAWVRGRAEPVRVFIDDVPSIGGLDHLALFRPEDLYLVEVFSGGRQIRAYTTWYMEQSARRGRTPVPILF